MVVVLVVAHKVCQRKVSTYSKHVQNYACCFRICVPCIAFWLSLLENISFKYKFKLLRSDFGTVEEVTSCINNVAYINYMDLDNM